MDLLPHLGERALQKENRKGKQEMAGLFHKDKYIHIRGAAREAEGDKKAEKKPKKQQDTPSDSYEQISLEGVM